MTAEVVIMNKHGMSLAADSAITSGRDGIQKVYNSANKLFSLSREHSIGIMVYGAASFMEVPWGIIIKSYREHLGDKKFADLADYADDLLDFICQDQRFKAEEIENIIIYRTFSDILKRIVREVEEDISNEKLSNGDITNEIVTDWLMECVERYIKSYKNKQETFLELEYKAFIEKFGSVIYEIREELITYDVPSALEEKLYELAFEVTKKDYFSIGSTGIVIAGYGEKEIFPHILNYRLEGFVFGQLKYKKLKEKKISYTTDKKDGTAAIIPFADRKSVV